MAAPRPLVSRLKVGITNREKDVRIVFGGGRTVNIAKCRKGMGCGDTSRRARRR